MKKIALMLLLLIISINFSYSQITPGGMKYQAVARDLTGMELSNKSLAIQIVLIGDINNSDVYYSEIHEITTNKFGLFSLTIGDGKTEFGDFDTIPWSKENIWIEVNVKTDGEDYFSPLSKSKLLAVPYAYHSSTANSLTNFARQPLGIPSQNWSLFGNRNTNPNKDKLGTTDNADLVVVTDNTERIRVLSSGQMEVRENAQFDKNINVDNITKTDYLVVADEANDTIPDLYPRDGSIVDVRGLFIADSIAIKGGLDIGGNLSVHGDRVDIDKDLYVGRNVHLNTNDQFSPQGQTINYGKFTSKGQVTINTETPLTGGDSNYNAYPLRVEGSDQGIAIKLNAGTPDNSNNFVSFFNNSGDVVGRIEGETAIEVASEAEYIFETSIYAAEVVAAGVNIVLSALPNACAGAGAVACPPEPSVVAIAIAEEVLALANAAAYQIFAFSDVGVTYQSGSADYAEWLERLNYSENILPGDIVNVIGGKITKNTNNSNQLLIASTNPAILGNMPANTIKERFEKIAFMGQVPTKVRGKVSIGDYIIPSGLNDGSGIAISPRLIKPEDYSKIVGIAWENSPLNQNISFVNTSIGLNNNDVANLIVEQQAKLDGFEKRIKLLEDKINQLISGNINTSVDESFDENQNQSLNIPTELNVSLINDAILLLENVYKDKGIDVYNHPGLKEIFTNESYRKEVIENVKKNYENSRLKILELKEKY